MKGGEYRVTLFADDMVLYLTKPGESLPELLDILKNFGVVSGRNINQTKSNMMAFNLSHSEEPCSNTGTNATDPETFFHI